MKHNSTLRTCSQGHRYHKTSDCPVCPICESTRKPEANFMAGLSAPARRALENANIWTVTQLAAHSEKEILALHGMGPSSIPKLRSSLKKNGLTFRK